MQGPVEAGWAVQDHGANQQQEDGRLNQEQHQGDTMADGDAAQQEWDTGSYCQERHGQPDELTVPAEQAGHPPAQEGEAGSLGQRETEQQNVEADSTQDRAAARPVDAEAVAHVGDK
jgi:hypothetical protein